VPLSNNCQIFRLVLLYVFIIMIIHFVIGFIMFSCISIQGKDHRNITNQDYVAQTSIKFKCHNLSVN